MQTALRRSACTHRTGARHQAAAARPFSVQRPGQCPPVQQRARVTAAAGIDPDNASILVCGGGGVALHVTKKLKDMGSWVWMMQVRQQLLSGVHCGQHLLVSAGCENHDVASSSWAGMMRVASASG
eukprot:GHRQ01025458.1.p2 GENE.GHRQ01025458.1~~GHRQ01025458.1.p2  ORF type:complete len:126 (+),score=28.78 GHRQ01025458.1:211-588(+)